MGTIYLSGITTQEFLTNIKEIIDESVKLQIANLEQQASPVAKELLTRKEVAEMFNISLPTLHNWVKAGILTKHNIGRRAYFKADEINDFLIKKRGEK